MPSWQDSVKAIARVLATGLITLALSACGQGIELDPSSRRTRTEAAGADSGDATARDDDASDAQADTPAADRDNAIPDALARDAQDEGDVAPDGHLGDASADEVDPGAVRDAFTDARGDFSVDSAGDAALDGGIDDVADAVNEPTDDRVIDARFDTIDVARDIVRDADAADAGDGCTVACWPAADYYVDASAPEGGNGSKSSPFKTITEAIAAYSLSPGVAKKAYVAPGTYDEALGEHFPLVLRGLSLEGAGPDLTLVVGTGALDHTGQGGLYPDHYTVTMVVGDRLLPTNVMRLAVQSTSPVPALEFQGIFCDQGNATGEVASPAGQTHFDQVTIGPGYIRSVLVTTSTLPSITGCNMLITRSTITGAVTGVEAAGCDGTAPDAPVNLEMGTDDPESGNTVSWMQSTNGIAVGVAVHDCVMQSSFQYNTISDSSVGMTVNGGISFPSNVVPHTSLKHNSFERNGFIGLGLALDNLFIDDVSDNRFVGNTRPLNGAFPQAARALVVLASDPMGRFRRNQFIGNDVGLDLTLGDQMLAPDFGTLSDPGNNTFRCNSGIFEVGADVVISADTADWTGTVPFAGNAWDHVPPTVQVANPAPNGSDIALPAEIPNINIDRQNATLSTAACPADRVPGQ